MMNEWLNLLLRWIHIVAAISWIGSSFYFMWLDSHLEAPNKSKGAHKDNVSGELWMVHSGGFYQVEKRLIMPGEMPSTLHWFKWEAAFTWISGLCLLLVVYYLGSGVYLIDESVAHLSVFQARTIGLGLLPISWLIYDGLYNSFLAKNKIVSSLVALAFLVAVIFGLSHLLSGRAAFIHVGAMLGTLMVANVWIRILPAQRQMIAATERGEKPDYTLGARAKLRSVHNNYMTFPVIFVMISNHFPSTYGNKLNWLVLFGLMLASSGVRYVMNKRTVSSRWILLPAAAVLAWVIMMTSPSHFQGPNSLATGKGAAGLQGQQAYFNVDSENSGMLSGVVRVTGNIVSPQHAEAVNFPAGCADQHGEPVFLNPLKVKKGGIQNVFVTITKGFEGKTFEPRSDEVVIDQKGCLYNPVVVGARVGQNVVFLNSDPVFHNVRSLDEKNPVFNEGMQNKGDRIAKKFMTPELMVHAHCDVHPWMNAFIGVIETPYFAVTDENGTFSLKDIPPGTYELTTWQEVLGVHTQSFTIKPRETTSIDVVYQAH